MCGWHPFGSRRRCPCFLLLLYQVLCICSLVSKGVDTQYSFSGDRRCNAGGLGSTVLSASCMLFDLPVVGYHIIIPPYRVGVLTLF
jgi:hypothetical protein